MLLRVQLPPALPLPGIEVLSSAEVADANHGLGNDKGTFPKPGLVVPERRRLDGSLPTLLTLVTEHENHLASCAVMKK